jgi:hypothetical protein
MCVNGIRPAETVPEMGAGIKNNGGGEFKDGMFDIL